MDMTIGISVHCEGLVISCVDVVESIKVHLSLEPQQNSKHDQSMDSDSDSDRTADVTSHRVKDYALGFMNPFTHP